MVYVVIVPNYWGKGATIEEAINKCRAAGGRYTKRTPHVIYSCSDDKCYVDPIDGSLYYATTDTVQILEKIR